MSFRAYRPLTQKKKKMNFFAFKAIANSQLSFFYQPSFFPHRHKYTLVIDIHHRKNLISRYPKIKNRHLSTRKIDRPFLLRLIRPTFCFLRFQRNFLFFFFKAFKQMPQPFTLQNTQQQEFTEETFAKIELVKKNS